MESNRVAIDEFFLALKKRLSRAIDIVTIIPLYGHANDFYSIAAAAEFLERHSIYEGSGEFRKYEIRVAFSNGDRVEASMNSKDRAREFLEQVGRT